MEKRKLNLIVSGLPESEADLKNFIHYANVNCKLPIPLTEGDIESCGRLGKPAAKPRLMKIRLFSATARRALLGMRASLEEQTEQGGLKIFIRPDHTKAQVLLDKQLRAELMVAGKDTHKISRGKIVERFPTANAPNATSTSAQDPTADGIENQPHSIPNIRPPAIDCGTSRPCQRLPNLK